MGMPESYASDVVPQTSDTKRMLLVKQLTSINAGGGGGGGGGGGSGNVVTWNGSGSKPTVAGPGICLGVVGSAVQGQIWIKTTAGTNSTDWNPI